MKVKSLSPNIKSHRNDGGGGGRECVGLNNAAVLWPFSVTTA